MGIKLGEALLLIRGDDQLEKDLAGVKKKLKHFGGQVGDILGAGLKVGAGAVLAGGAALGAVLVSATKDAMAAEQVQAQLAAVLKSTGGAAGVTAEQVNDLANALSLTTTFEDDAIVSGQNLLLTFTNIGQDVFPDATQTMLDMSTALGQDLNSSAMQLGKALNDPIAGISALTRVGVSFTEEQKSQIKTLQESGDLMGAQKIILAELGKEFGGAAAAAGGTFAGQLTILNNQLGNVKEEIGAALLPVLSDLLREYGPQLIEFIRTTAAWIVSDLVPALKTTVEWIAVNLVPAVILVVGWLRDNLIPVIIDVANWIGSTLIPAIVSVIEWLQVNLPPAIATAQRVFNDVAGAVRAISDAIRNVIEWIQRMIERLQAIRLPSWLTPGSPTPFELGLRGIADAMGDLVGITPPAMGFAVAGMGGGAGARYAPASITINQAFGPGTAADVRSAARQGVESALSVARAKGLL